MPRIASTRITQTAVRNARPKTHRYEIRDSAIPGFMLRVSPNGRMHFYLQLERGKKRKIADAQVVTLTRARELALDMLRRYEAGEELDHTRASKPNLESFISGRFADWARDNLKNGEKNVGRLNSCTASLLNTRIDRLTTSQIENWKSQRLNSGRTPATVKRDLAELKAALSRAVQWELISTNPAKGVTVREDQHHRTRYLTDDERDRLLRALQDRDEKKQQERASANVFRTERGYETKPELGVFADYLTPLVMLAMNTGLRRSELFSLEWRSVDFDPTPRVTVLAAYSKSRRTRYVPLNSIATEVLKSWASCRESERLVFANSSGGQLTTIKTAWRNLMKQAKITDFRFHDLRHDFASRLVMQGVDLYHVKELLGHSSIDITQRYAHLSPQSLAVAVQAIV